MSAMPAQTRRVLLAKPRGYCAGVDRAVQTVERALERFGAPVYVRKQIVHNTHVVGDARGARRDLRRGDRGGPRGLRGDLLRPRRRARRCATRPRTAACGPSTRPARWSRRCTARPAGSPRRATTSCSSATRATRRSSAHRRGARAHPAGRRPGRAATSSRCGTRRRWPGSPRPPCRWTRPTRPWPRCGSGSRSCSTRRATTSATPPRTGRSRSSRSRQRLRPGHRRRLAELLELGAPGRGRARRRRAGGLPGRRRRPGRPAWLTGAMTVGVTSGASVPEDLVDGVLARLAAARLRRRSRKSRPWRSAWCSRSRTSCASPRRAKPRCSALAGRTARARVSGGAGAEPTGGDSRDPRAARASGRGCTAPGRAGSRPRLRAPRR